MDWFWTRFAWMGLWNWLRLRKGKWVKYKVEISCDCLARVFEMFSNKTMWANVTNDEQEYHHFLIGEDVDCILRYGSKRTIRLQKGCMSILHTSQNLTGLPWRRSCAYMFHLVAEVWHAISSRFASLMRSWAAPTRRFRFVLSLSDGDDAKDDEDAFPRSLWLSIS